MILCDTIVQTPEFDVYFKNRINRFTPKSDIKYILAYQIFFFFFLFVSFFFFFVFFLLYQKSLLYLFIKNKTLLFVNFFSFVFSTLKAFILFVKPQKKTSVNFPPPFFLPLLKNDIFP